jgi:mevalonate kinase
MKAKGQGKAHAKVIIIGEHAVVYGHPGIAIPFVPLTVQVEVGVSDQDRLTAPFFKGFMEQLPDELLFLFAHVNALREVLKFPQVHIRIHNDIPTSAGLGSSAAITSALTVALYDWMEVPLAPGERFEWTQKSEKMVHGNPSGIDALMVQSMTPFWFAKGKQPKSISMNLKGSFVIIDSGVAGKTKQAVANVAGLYMKNIAQVHLESIGLMVPLLEEAIMQNDENDLARLMNQTHYHLKELNLTHEKVEWIIEESLKLGATGAKITGGGLGGSVLLYVPLSNDAKAIHSYFESHHLKVWVM